MGDTPAMEKKRRLAEERLNLPDPGALDRFSLARRAITTFAWIITFILATVINIHFLTGMNQNKTDISELRETVTYMRTSARTAFSEQQKAILYIRDNLDVNVILIKELRRDVTNLGKSLDSEARVLFEKLKKLRADVMTVNRSTHNLAAWVKRVDADYDPGLAAKYMTDVERLQNHVYWLKKGQK